MIPKPDVGAEMAMVGELCAHTQFDTPNKLIVQTQDIAAVEAAIIAGQRRYALAVLQKFGCEWAGLHSRSGAQIAQCGAIPGRENSWCQTCRTIAELEAGTTPSGVEGCWRGPAGSG